MIIAVDVGNTTVTFGLFQDNDLILRFSMPSSSRTTAQKCWSKLQTFLSPDIEITGAICSSTVAEMTEIIRSFVNKYIKVPFRLLHVTDNTGIVNRYEPPQQLGVDRIANAIAVKNIYTLPSIILDLGTAITIDVVNKKSEFLGGIIAPGIGTSANALHKNTSLLPKVELTIPDSILGTNTVSAMQSGLMYGFAGMLRYFVEKLKKECSIEDAAVVLTGGHSGIIEPLLSDIVTVIDANLTLKGLNRAYSLI